MAGPLSDEEIEEFVTDGFVRLTHAFPRALAEECRDLLWEQLPCDRDDPSTWTTPVIWMSDPSAEPFTESLSTPRVHDAVDQLVGPGRWLPATGVGTFPLRFPSQADPGGTGWRAGGSVAPDDGRPVTLASEKGQALVALFFYSDVTPVDAPTRLRRGSHVFVAGALAQLGTAGAPAPELPPLDADIEQLEIVPAVGRAGDVYLCHPLLLTAESPQHRGNRPRIIAQPALAPRGPLVLDAGDDHPYSPVERAIRRGLTRAG